MHKGTVGKDLERYLSKLQFRSLTVELDRFCITCNRFLFFYIQVFTDMSKKGMEMNKILDTSLDIHQIKTVFF